MAAGTETQAQKAFGEQLQQQTTGCKLATYSLSRRRSMPTGAVNRVATLFNAQASSVGGSRQVINPKHPLVKPVFFILSKAKDLVHTYTIDYPEKGTRLIKISRVEWMDEQIKGYQQELDKALADLDAGWDAVKADAKERLGDLYSEGDYPVQPSAGFGIEISYPAIKPDDRLATLHPELYEEQKRRIAARFDEAVLNAEAAAAEELAKMLKHLVERLQPDAEGKAKTLHESTVTNLKEFAQRFKDLTVGSNADLEKLVNDVELAAAGVDVKALRKADGNARAAIQSQFDALRESVDKLVITRPVRVVDLDDLDS